MALIAHRLLREYVQQRVRHCSLDRGANGDTGPLCTTYCMQVWDPATTVEEMPPKVYHSAGFTAEEPI